MVLLKERTFARVALCKARVESYANQTIEAIGSGLAGSSGGRRQQPANQHRELLGAVWLQIRRTP
jgi:hypothetical protein